MSVGAITALGGDQAAGRPLIVIDALELLHMVREQLGDAADQKIGYTEPHTALKTDIALTVAGADLASRQILGGDVRTLVGWAFAETTGAASATFRLHDGNGVGGEQFARINLATNESVRDWFLPHGIRCATGRVFLEMLSGSVEGVIFWR